MSLYKPIRNHGYIYIACVIMFVVFIALVFRHVVKTYDLSTLPVGPTLLLIAMMLILIGVPLFIGIGLLLRNRFAFRLYIESLKVMKWRNPKMTEDHLNWIKDNNIERYLKK